MVAGAGEARLHLIGDEHAADGTLGLYGLRKKLGGSE